MKNIFPYVYFPFVGVYKGLWLIFFFFFAFFRAALAAHGSSQARCRIRATAAGLYHSHSMQDQSHVYNLHHSSWQRQIPDPLSKASDQTHILMDTSQIHFHCTTTGTLLHFIFYLFFKGGCTMQKFPGQGSNLSHSCNHSHSSDNDRSLTHWATSELQNLAF